MALTLYQLSAGRDEEDDAAPELGTDLTLALVAVLDKQGTDPELISKALNVNFSHSRKGE